MIYNVSFPTYLSYQEISAIIQGRLKDAPHIATDLNHTDRPFLWFSPDRTIKSKGSYTHVAWADSAQTARETLSFESFLDQLGRIGAKFSFTVTVEKNRVLVDDRVYHFGDFNEVTFPTMVEFAEKNKK